MRNEARDKPKTKLGAAAWFVTETLEAVAAVAWSLVDVGEQYRKRDERIAELERESERSVETLYRLYESLSDEERLHADTYERLVNAQMLVERYREVARSVLSDVMVAGKLVSDIYEDGQQTASDEEHLLTARDKLIEAKFTIGDVSVDTVTP